MIDQNKNLLWKFFPLLLIVFAFIIYGRTLFSGLLMWDDLFYITESELVTKLGLSNIIEVFRQPQFANYAPLNTLLLGLQYKIFAGNPLGFRLVILSGHIINSLLVFLISNELTKKRFAAAVIAMIFLVHPANVENVAWVSQHKTVISSLFLLSAIWIYIKDESRAAVVVLSIIAMLIKSVAIIVPALLITYDLIFKSEGFKKTFLRHLSLTIFAAGIAFMNILTQRATSTVTPPHGGLAHHIFGVISLPGYYILKTLAPLNLSPLYLIRELRPLIYIPFTALLVFIGIFAWIKKWRVVLFSLLWFIIMLLPVLNIIPMVIWVADRYVYLPMIGLLIAAAYALAEIPSEKWRRVAFIGGSFVIILFSYLSFDYAGIWRNDLSLWRHAEKISQGVVIYGNLANALAANGEYDEAIKKIDAAIAIDPDRSLNYAIKGQICQKKGDYLSAIQSFFDAIKRNPHNQNYYKHYGQSVEEAEKLGIKIPESIRLNLPSK